MNAKKMTTRQQSGRTLLATLLTGALAACSSAPAVQNSSNTVPANWLDNAIPQLPERDRSAQQTTLQKEEPTSGNRFFQTPSLPERKVPPVQTVVPYKQADEPGKKAAVAFDGMPLPQFITSVFGVILKKTITLDPQIQQRRDLVSMRAGKEQTSSQLYESAKTVLRAYGVTVQELPGLTRFVPDNADSSSLPEIRRGRAMPEVPETLRPMFYMIEMENTQASYVANWLRTIFKEKITIYEENNRNALILSGTTSSVSAAMQTIIALDQPLMRGRLSARITPIYWTAEELQKRLYEILTTEGYFSGTQPGSVAPVVMLPIGSSNSVIVFANNQSLLDHTMKWAEDLDLPTKSRSGNFFVYPVRNADAADIATTMSQALGGGSATTATTATSGQSPSKNSRIVVNKATNSLILQASAAEYEQWRALLQELDRPAKSALVTISVAEVRLKDGEKFGFEWLVNKIRLGGLEGSLSTMGRFNTSGIGGLGFSLGDSASPSVILNALANTSQARILSNPTILTRSGEDANISIGQEVPVVTSQTNNGTTTSSGTANITQTIQYRSTGVIMKVKPVVHSGGRIDLTVSQEVSSISTDKVGAAESPTLNSRKLDTRLTVRDGNTVVLGGLMSDSQSDSNTGVPYAKDIPFFGSFFKSTDKSTDRTELVMLITAYAIEDDFDVESISDAFRKRFPWTSPLYHNTPTPVEPAESQPSPNSTPQTKEKPYVRPTVTEDVRYEAASTRLPTGLEPVVTPAQYDNTLAAVNNAQPLSAKKSGPTAPLPSGGQGVVVTDDALKQELLKALQGTGKP